MFGNLAAFQTISSDPGADVSEGVRGLHAETPAWGLLMGQGDSALCQAQLEGRQARALPHHSITASGVLGSRASKRPNIYIWPLCTPGVPTRHWARGGGQSRKPSGRPVHDSHTCCLHSPPLPAELPGHKISTNTRLGSPIRRPRCHWGTTGSQKTAQGN